MPTLRSAACSALVMGALALAPAGCRRSPERVGPPAPVVEGMNRGVSLMGQYLYDDAARAFEEVLTAAPHLTEARVNLAIALFNRNRKEDLEASEKLLATVLEKEPDNLRALYFRAIVLQHVGKAEEANPCLEAVVAKRGEDGAAWYLLALCKQRVGQPAEAEFLRAAQYRPYLYSAYYQLYQTAMRAGEDAKAQEYMAKFKMLRASPLGESIELPQYNQMGELALTRAIPAVVAPPVARSQYRLSTAPPRVLWSGPALPGAQPASAGQGGAALGDVDRDGRVDVVVVTGASGGVVLLRQTAPATFAEATAGSGLEALTNVASCAVGDFDHDDLPDLFLVSGEGGHLFRGKGDGTFADLTRDAGLEAAPTSGRSGLFLDADHDGDLDLFVCAAGANQLWNNSGNGAWTNLAARASLGAATNACVRVLPGDLDQDRDMDLVLLRAGQPAAVFLNELLGCYREAEATAADLLGDAGGVLQDFTGDGLPDLLVLGGSPHVLRLFRGDGHARFQSDESFASMAKAAGSWGPLAGIRAADVDLDGDLDIVGFGTAIHLWLNDGRGRFVFRAEVWRPAPGFMPTGIEVGDVTGDLVPDLMVFERGGTSRLLLAAGELTPPSTGLALQPTGTRSRDGRTRSPGSGYGVTLTARAGLREQRLLYTGQSGGANQSWLPAVLGLGGVGKADYVDFLWPDGVAQVEVALVAGQTHPVAELQRKISSCPVLFTWNGERFEFVTDFAGVGGLGYFSAPGIAAPPQVLEHIKIEPGQLRVREGRYELRVTEPMEESAYVDRLELVAIDHPAHGRVYPDERLAISGAPPSHELLVVTEPIRPVRATDPFGRDCTENLARADRVYAYAPPLDRRYIGFCRPHTLEVDFADRLASVARDDRLVLFLQGFIEYPYSQTVYAASQSGIGWEPIRIEAAGPDGRWQIVVADGGVPGGMGRMMTIDLTGLLPPQATRLRLTTNLEVFYDEMFVARVDGPAAVSVRTVPLLAARLRYLGFPREYSPDGREPLIYDYERCDVTAPFHRLRGAYTRYGQVEELLADFDDRYALVGPGDEIALAFDATRLPEVAADQVRSFVLISHAYCKDMDLYTATPQTLEPLPFRAMSCYPYPPAERYPTSEVHQAFLRTYNTRLID